MRAVGRYQPPCTVPAKSPPHNLLGRDLLQKHCQVGKPEREARTRIMAKQCDTGPDAAQAGGAVVEEPLPRLGMSFNRAPHDIFEKIGKNLRTGY